MSFMSKLREWLVVNNFTAEERAELAAAVATVKRGLGAFLEAGEALLRIRDKQLYRNTHPTFESFAVAEFGLTGRRLQQLSESYEIVRSLKSISPNLPTPQVEAAVRPLAGLPDDLKLAAYQDAVDAAGGESPSPRQVREAAARRKPAPKKAARPVRFRVPGAIVEVVPNRAFGGVVEALEAALNQARQAAVSRSEAA